MIWRDKWSQVEDEWRWSLEADDRFSVKSMYKKLEGLMVWKGNLMKDKTKVFTQI